MWGICISLPILIICAHVSKNKKERGGEGRKERKEKIRVDISVEEWRIWKVNAVLFGFTQPK